MSEPTKIMVKCPKCEHEITIAVATIDKLRAENEALRKDRDTLKARLAALEFMKNNPQGYDGAINDLMKKMGLGL